MEAATTTTRDLAGEKAQRIIGAMRASVARHGSAASTFDHVAREAGVSRGLLHYYFHTKEQLLVEMVRHDCELRMAVLDRDLSGARSAHDFIEALVSSLEDMLGRDPEFITLFFEVFALSQRNPDIALELAELLRRTRAHVADLLGAKEEEGVLRLEADPEAIAEILFSIADGIALRMLTEPARDYTATVGAAVSCARTLVADPPG